MTDPSKPNLLIFYDHFSPAYKAGGPIQSLINLVASLQHVYNISVITSAYDLNETEVLLNIEINTWTELLLPQTKSVINVWYAGQPKPGKDSIKKLILQANPSVVYLNGMFSYRFVILPLIAIKKTRIVVCPRGMLQKGALAGKSVKKRIYLAVLKLSGLVKHITWHATNEAEKDDIVREFGIGANIVVATNIPRKPLANIGIPKKEAGELQLVYLSLISEKKNLLQLINIVSMLEENISLDIYGPVKDESYFKKCLEAINRNTDKVIYNGDVLPEKVQEIFSRYHASILLTKGENFGHALYESLSAGRPVITSHFTPWGKLEDKKAGWNVDITNEQEIQVLLSNVCNMDQSSYELFCNGAYRLANEYYNNGVDIQNYKKLFS